ncbi:MAG TPA: Abi-alpha family protein, partial [Jatrophihabitantaceae bacterium]|nr:Abi-alpha family protein [Jatrophihabitantaceae bacterium]
RLPGGAAVQREVQRLQDAALTEMRRLLDIPDGGVAMTNEEHRAVLLVQNSTGREPLREAMNELLERSVESDRGASRDYLFGSIISQLVPDEARIMAALSDGAKFAAIDVVAKQLGRGSTRTVLANASTVGRNAGVVSPDNVPAYVTRLHNFGLVEFGPADDDIDVQFDILAADSTVQAAQSSAEARRLGSPKLVRKTLTISPFGRDFWTATDPSRAGAGPR